MNAGYASLTALKAHLLHADLRAETGYDAPILQLGLGVANLIEGVLNRKLARAVDDTYITRGGRGILLLPRYPVEALTSIETRLGNADAWTVQAGEPLTWSAESGLVTFYAPPGDARWQVRTTYTGGYWWPTAEGTEEAVIIGALTRSATLTLVSGADTAAITFDEALPFAPTSVSVSLLVPEGQPTIAVNVVAGSPATTGFTITLAAPLPASGYQLTYTAVGDIYSDAESASVLPEGATELPAAIKTAWLLQVEHLWRLRDKLGLSITNTSSDKPAPGLQTADLLPVVKDMLRDHVRYTL